MGEPCRPRPGDVVHRALPGRECLLASVAVMQIHAVLVERDDRRFQIERALQLGRRGLDLALRIQRPLRRQTRLEPIRRDGGAAGVAAVVGPADRIGDHAQAPRPAIGDQPLQDARRADSLVVVTDQYEIGRLEQPIDRHAEPDLDLRRDGRTILVVDADHLLRMPRLGPADVAFLHGRGPIRIGEDSRVVDAGCGGGYRGCGFAVEIVADDAGQRHAGAEERSAWWATLLAPPSCQFPRGDRPRRRMTGTS